jgi:YD repeat-containing protein
VCCQRFTPVLHPLVHAEDLHISFGGYMSANSVEALKKVKHHRLNQLKVGTMRRKLSGFITLLFLITSLLVACSSPSASLSPSLLSIARIDITPSAVLLTGSGETHTLSAQAYDAQGNPVEATFTWTSLIIKEALGNWLVRDCRRQTFIKHRSQGEYLCSQA